MGERIDADLCVIGAGAGGLAVAAAASQLGAGTVLVERGRMGGQSRDSGIAALMAAARHAAAIRRSREFGIAAEPTIDFAAVMDHVHRVIAELAPQDSEARFTALGVRVIRAEARFTGPGELVAGNVTIRARRFVIATGSVPAIPPLAGLDAVPFLTTETIFDNRALPAHLLVIGAGAAGLELAQAHRLLGARVTVIDADRALAEDDPELSALLLERLRRDGIEIFEGAHIAHVERAADGVAVTVDGGAGEQRIEASHLLVAAGRRLALDGLALDRAGIAIDAQGLVLDRRLRTTNRRVYAVGDAAGGPQSSHAAQYQAGIVIRNALFRLPAKADYRALPRVTYTLPELAQVGLTEAQARRQFGADISLLRAPFADSDRAHAERATEGLVKIVARRNGRILGAAILGAAAGELISLWALALEGGVKLKTIAGMIAPYPTLSEASKRAAASHYLPKLLNDRTRAVVRFLARFG